MHNEIVGVPGVYNKLKLKMKFPLHLSLHSI